MNGLSCVKGEIHNVLAVLHATGRGDGGGGFFDFGGSGKQQMLKILKY